MQMEMMSTMRIKVNRTRRAPKRRMVMREETMRVKRMRRNRSKIRQMSYRRQSPMRKLEDRRFAEPRVNQVPLRSKNTTGHTVLTGPGVRIVFAAGAGVTRTDPAPAKKGVCPHFAMDYGYLHDKSPEDEEAKRGGTAVLFGVDASTGLGMAMMVPAKGPAEPWIARRIASWLNRLGSSRVVIKADSEPAIQALMDDIRRERGAETTTVPEEPTEGESQSNHYAEGYVNIVKGLVRTFIDAIECTVKTKLDSRHPLLPWIIEHAAAIRNQYQKASDGRTPIERLRGRAAKRTEYEIGESVHFIPLNTQQAKRGTMLPGIYLGSARHGGNWKPAW